MTQVRSLAEGDNASMSMVPGSYHSIVSEHATSDMPPDGSDEEDVLSDASGNNTIQRQRTHLFQQRHLWIGSAASIAAALAGLACVSLGIATLRSSASAAQTLSSWSPRALAGELCKDTPGWANGYWQCTTNGYAGRGCTKRGFTCEAYVTNGWCVAGEPAKGKAWAFGEALLFPELNCCGCGGGSGSASVLLAARAPPNVSQCCDTPNWNNGYWKCNTNGYTGRGCSPHGLTCEAYAANGWCVDGKPTEGKDWAMGQKLLFPELNCCVCGGGSGNGSVPASGAAVAVPLS